MIDAETIRVWRINYGLDKRTPQAAMQWWHESMGSAPVGAVAALGVCIDEIERLYAERGLAQPSDAADRREG